MSFEVKLLGLHVGEGKISVLGGEGFSAISGFGPLIYVCQEK